MSQLEERFDISKQLLEDVQSKRLEKLNSPAFFVYLEDPKLDLILNQYGGFNFQFGTRWSASCDKPQTSSAPAERK